MKEERKSEINAPPNGEQKLTNYVAIKEQWDAINHLSHPYTEGKLIKVTEAERRKLLIKFFGDFAERNLFLSKH